MSASERRDQVLDGLLAIDVDAELRKLAESALHDAWQFPAALVRLAIAAFAKNVNVTIERYRCRVRHDGRSLGADALRALHALFDTQADPTRRHRALLELETAGVIDLLALLALRPRRCQVLASDGMRVVFDSRRAPHLDNVTGSAQQNSIEVEGSGWNARRMAEHLQAVCRFAPVTVVVNGTTVSVGCTDAFAEIPLAEPLSGRMALIHQEDPARLLLLLDGVVAAHLTVPAFSGFLAVIETRPLVRAGDARAAALREIIVPWVSMLVSRAMDQVLLCAERMSDLPEDAAITVRGLILSAARRRLRTPEVLRARAFPAVFGPEIRERRWLSLLDVGQAAEGANRVLWAIDPDSDPNAFLIPRRPVWVLGAAERARLSELLGVTFRRPQEHRTRPTVAGLFRQRAGALQQFAREAFRTIFHHGRPVAESTLTAAEKTLIEALRSSLDTGDGARIVLVNGCGRLRRVGAGRWVLGRRQPTVVAAAEAVQRDPAWTYPAAFALLEGRCIPSEAARAAWRESGR